MKKRRINSRARGKHLGHACEGHFRGVLHHIARQSGSTVARSLPFEFPVESDAILLDKDGRIRAIFIVAYWENARNSDSKFYRTRTEYAEAWRSRSAHSPSFAVTLQVFTILYGTRDGWKVQVLEDLRTQCPPLLFLPDLLTTNSLQSVIKSAYQDYSSRWEAGNSDAREVVEQLVSVRPLSAAERKIEGAIVHLLAATPSDQMQRSELRSQLKIRLPQTPLQTRYRQALSILSVFGAGEVEAWHSQRRIASPLTDAFARRAFFLGLGSFSVTKSIVQKKVVRFTLRQAIAENGSYEAHRPDFSGWLKLSSDDLGWIIKSHRSYTCKPSTVFRGGALDQVIGNSGAIAAELSDRGMKLVRAARSEDPTKVGDVLMRSAIVSALPSHDGRDEDGFLPLWGGVTSAIAMAENTRALRSDLGCRRVDKPSSSEAFALAKRFIKSKSAPLLFAELVEFSAEFITAKLETLSQLRRPRLLELDEPCSLMADFYNTLTTNPSHNPLNAVLRRWLLLKFPDLQWDGWPSKRGANPSTAIDGKGRRQWTFVAKQGNHVVCAEAKSVTANNWGNKSKEIFDRVAELRTICVAAGMKCSTLLMFDGDLSAENMRELSSGIAHDEIWSVDEVLADIQNHSDRSG